MISVEELQTSRLPGMLRRRFPEELEINGVSRREGIAILAELNLTYDRVDVHKHLLRVLGSELVELHRAHPRRTLRLLDLGMRDGYFLRRLGGIAAAHAIPVELRGVEFRQDICRHAQAINRHNGIEVHQDQDFTFAEFSDGDCDLVFSNFALHHRTPEEAGRFVAHSCRIARHAVHHFDFSRSYWGGPVLWLAYRLMRLHASRRDAVISCLTAYRRKEVQRYLAKIAPPERSETTFIFPFYFLASHRKQDIAVPAGAMA